MTKQLLADQPSYLQQLIRQLGDPAKKRGVTLASREDAVQLITERYSLAHFFVYLLELIAMLVASHPGVSRALADNREEELGTSERDYGPRHKWLRDILIRWLGVDPDKWEASLGHDLFHLDAMPPWARHILEWHVRLARRDALEAAAAIAYWELRIPFADYPLLRDTLYGPLLGYPPSGLAWVARDTPLDTIPADVHLLSHIDHDVHHFLDLFKELAKVMDEHDLKEAILAAHAKWEEGWDLWKIARA